MLNKVSKIAELKDPEAIGKLDEIDFKFIKFAYRWINCFLTREFNVRQVMRLWDTFLSEE